MEPQKTANSREVFEQGLARTGEARYVLSLYVAGATRRSTQAIANLKAICETHLQGRYGLEVIDICQQPAHAREQEIVAVPTRVRNMVGDKSRGNSGAPPIAPRHPVGNGVTRRGSGREGCPPERMTADNAGSY